jgi:hypothetical protein
MKQSVAGLFLACLLLWQTTIGFAQPILNGKAAAPWIEWDRTTERVVSAPSDTGAAYPRARQLSNGEILLAYHHGAGLGDYGAGVTLRKSRDGGSSWYQTQEVEGPREKGFWGFSNPDFIELGQGRLMLVSSARGKPDPRSEDPFLSEGQHSGLRVRFSDNYGSTWGPPRLIAAGRGRVWEPSIVRLPDGELEIFYANESPFLEDEGATQCIESIRSADEGQTWSAPTLISEQAGCRNGMPAALTLANGHVVCGEEVVGLGTSPWLADTLHGQTRNFHLAQDQYDFGAAPFLARAPDGGTLLAFHSQCLQASTFKRLSMSWMFSQIYVQHGDAEAGNFGPASCPWPAIGMPTGAFFPSLMVLKSGTLVAMASFITIHPDRTTSTVVRWIKGRMLAAETKPARAALAQSASSFAPASASAAPGAEAEYKYGPPPDDESKRSGAGY